MRNNLLYLVYGQNEVYHREAKLSVLTALAHRVHEEDFSITVMTDSPSVFEGWPVQTISLSPETLSVWKGDLGYTHRIKACAIQAGAAHAEKTVFIDTDTLFKCSPSELFKRIDSSSFLVDEFEFAWQHACTRSEFSGLVAHLEAQRDQVPPQLRLYNSGIFGLQQANAAIMDAVIQRIDQWSAFGTQLHTIEQIALSFALADKTVQEGRDCIVHYYAEKEFFHAMAQVFFSKHGEAFTDALVALSAEMPRAKPQISFLHRLRVKLAVFTADKHLKRPIRNLMYGSLLPRDAYSISCAAVFVSKGVKGLQALNVLPAQSVPGGRTDGAD